MISITPIPAFEDNYFWLIDNGEFAAVVDPGDAQPVRKHLKNNNLKLSHILITHHHSDHTGGIKTLKEDYNCQVIGPAKELIKHIDIKCQQDDQIFLASLKIDFKVLDVPGHTLGHIAYFADAKQLGTNSLFCGDTLFSAGCGRIFEGTAEQMWHSLQKISNLPDDTQIFPAHEYTLSNIAFAESIEPENTELKQLKKQAKEKRLANIPTLPTLLKTEKAINPFLRVTEDSIISTAKNHTKMNKNQTSLSTSEIFATIRQLKDHF